MPKPPREQDPDDDWDYADEEDEVMRVFVVWDDGEDLEDDDD